MMITHSQPTSTAMPNNTHVLSFIRLMVALGLGILLAVSTGCGKLPTWPTSSNTKENATPQELFHQPDQPGEARGLDGETAGDIPATPNQTLRTVPSARPDTVAPAYPDVSKQSSQNIQDQINAFLTTKDLHIGPDNTGDAWIGMAIEPVGTDYRNLAFGPARLAAIERAVLRIKMQYVTEISWENERQQILSDVDDERIGDELTRTSADQLDSPSKLMRKLDTLGNASLDILLRKASVPESEIQTLNQPSEKRLRFRQATHASSLRHSLERLGGIRVLHSVEGVNEAGGYSVGVIMVWSPAQQRIAEAVRSGHVGQFPDAAGLPDAATVLALPTERLLYEHGLQLVSRNGQIGVLVFGQSAPAITAADPPIYLEQRLRSARDSSYQAAVNTLTEWVGSVIAVDVFNEQYEVTQVVDVIQRDGSIDTRHEYQILTQTLKRAESQARARVQGFVIQRQWQANHPLSGSVCVGTIAYWSVATQLDARTRHDMSQGRDPVGQPAAREPAPAAPASASPWWAESIDHGGPAW